MSGDLKHVISLGAGVQSSTMALMAAAGEITPMPNAAVFADTQAEPESVYRWLDWLESQLPFPVVRVSRGNLAEESTRVHVSQKTGRRYTTHDTPAYTLSKNGEVGRANRSCTFDFKVVPIIAELRRIGEIKRGQKSLAMVQWMGISRDEFWRMKPSRFPWVQNRFPLVDAGITRQECIQWMQAHGFPHPPRSACVFCPFHNSREWKRLKDEEPHEFARAAAFEIALQAAKASADNFYSVPFLHKSCIPIETVDFSSESDAQLNLFNAECEGLCGV